VLMVLQFAREVRPHAQRYDVEDADRTDGWSMDPDFGTIAAGHEEDVTDHLAKLALCATDELEPAIVVGRKLPVQSHPFVPVDRLHDVRP